MGLNCEENTNLQPYYSDSEIILALSQINRESLVFKYDCKYAPNVLFTADSGFEFLAEGEKVKLQDNSIVTAPHHGSGDTKHSNVYNNIIGNSLIYVRSDSKSGKNRPCLLYKALNKKYCTTCNKNSHLMITLSWDGIQWNTKAKPCSC